ncbi:hypothetical protein QVD17_36321 [Tagetes erecta]|uniref:Senescence regulator n=1 Tax=Tagetes erecta TaxID=13708 RepID=A0AAD8JSI5_TARER|nr:hypothetical protein QVD17_36321 [Tagetes erecta]
MATRSKFLNYLGSNGDQRINPVDTDTFEINESDLWNNNNNNIGFDDHSPDTQNMPTRRSKFPLKSHHQRKTLPVSTAAKSLPVNVPDWSKILRDEYKHEKRHNDDEGDDEDDDKLPPHEYLARTRIASFSVHEGIGRTLKGRDLSRVRNAIWKKTGFELD